MSRGAQLIIRKYEAADEDAIYDICLRTGRDGEDASDMYDDPRLVGHVFAGPYVRLEPDFAFVLDPADGRPPIGYVLGTPDTRQFEVRCEKAWWPELRRIYADPTQVPERERTPDQARAYSIHHPYPADADIVAEYPAHLHIDLLPEAQGGGNGRALMETLFAALADVGAPGVHLGVSATNTRAVGFYRRLGFAELKRVPGAYFLGKSLIDG
jgi:GNAT superfamily N-acetyltransferase